MPLTKEQVAAYLADPWTCPFCGAQGEDLGALRSDDWDDLDGVELMVRISCSKCDKTWRNYYKLHDVEEEDRDGYAIPNEEGGTWQSKLALNAAL